MKIWRISTGFVLSPLVVVKLLAILGEKSSGLVETSIDLSLEKVCLSNEWVD